ncbi:AAA family ATPase [Phytomonospora sp. NPDC050363]|uniref:AAA family ATPase n=1 Tax=Phytomonospora sp. NPDC050363 TaxID=3155642 RepID=UPI0034099688
MSAHDWSDIERGDQGEAVRRLRAVPTDQECTDTTPVRRVAWTLDELMVTEFAPPKWAVDGLICEGVTLFTGPPKVGKSWASLDMAICVAAGRRVFGRLNAQAGPVLYLALEDTARRLKSRARKLLGVESAPAGLTLVTQCAPLGQGGDEAIVRWIEDNPSARMVIIDVFAKMRPNAVPGSSAYDADYAAINRVKRIADRYAIAIVLIHHVRKAASEDFLQQVSGTNGLAGSADATIVLTRARGQADGVLHVTGRDVDEAEHAMSFDSETGHWTLLDGPVAEHTTTDTRAAILRHLRANGATGPKAIADATGVDYSNIKKTCRRMVDDGVLSVDARTRYNLPTAPGQGDTTRGTPPVSPVSPMSPSGSLPAETQGDKITGVSPYGQSSNADTSGRGGWLIGGDAR